VIFLYNQVTRFTFLYFYLFYSLPLVF